MTNVEWYHAIVGKYRRGLGRINAKYDQQIEDKKSYAGSAGYAKDIEKIDQQRRAAIGALRDECRDDFTRCVQSMEKHAQARPAVAPTQEQLAILQVLQMREKLTRDDLRHAANAMQGCTVALDVLDELAKKHEILGFYAPSGVSDQFVSDAIKAFARNANTILTLDRTNQRRELIKGTEGPNGSLPSFENTRKFRVDTDPESAQDCAQRFGGVPADLYEVFCEATGVD